jgi:hypothetical protein
MTKRSVFLILCLCFSVSAFAQIGGEGVYQFLNLPVSARTVALGGKIVPVLDNDISLSYANPSVLDSGFDKHLSLNTVSYLEKVNYGYVSYAMKTRNYGTFAPGLLFIRYGDFVSADAYGNITGNFTASEYAFNLGYAKELDSVFTIGLNMKFITSLFEQYSSYGAAVDISGAYNNSKYLFSAVGVLKNIGVQLKPYVEGYSEKLPFEIQLGFSKKFSHAPLRFSLVAHNLQKYDLTYSKPTDPSAGVSFFNTQEDPNKEQGTSEKILRHLVLGAEILLSKNFNLRAAFDYQKRKELAVIDKGGLVGFSFGFGLHISKFDISYGRATYHLAGSVNAFSVTANLNEFYRKKK